MSDHAMFCFQCEQTFGGKGCTVKGVCGKLPDVAALQNEITVALIALAKALKGEAPDAATRSLFLDGLFMTITNVNFDGPALQAQIDKILAAVKADGGGEVMPQDQLFVGDTDIVSLRSTLLFGLRGTAAYAHHAAILGKTDAALDAWFVRAMAALGAEHSVEEWLGLIMECGQQNLTAMGLLDAGNNEHFGAPSPVQVSRTIEGGRPFVVVTGHDLLDLLQLLQQTDGQGVDIYTHGEMLPAHGYPKLRAFKHLKGHFGTAWQNQQREFDGLPGAVLYTTNCLMPPKPTYQGALFTTAVVGYPELVHIAADANGKKDFSALIAKARELGGYKADMKMGDPLMTGFGHVAVLSVADKVVDAVKSGALKHIFLVGGCDGAKSGRNYYTEFVEKTPKDTLVLTLACGKFRFNHLQGQLGDIGGIPRLLDMGQCNDAYSAIQVAVALAKVFNCGVNDLPLSLVLSWYEQKAVCILLTLLSLGIKDIRLGPSLPAFVSPTVLNVLVEKFGIRPITTPDEDLAAILKK